MDFLTLISVDYSIFCLENIPFLLLTTEDITLQITWALSHHFASSHILN